MLDTIIRIPPFNVRVQSSFPEVRSHLDRFYEGFARLSSDAFVDFDVQLLPGKGVRRLWRKQVRFQVDSQTPFLPLPADQAAPLLEWGLNWTIASRSLGYLVLHAAVLARHDRAVILPGFPGAGKSTLCASLCHLRDWQLFSDELAIVRPDDGRLVAHPRPISLKNQSIDLVSAFPGASLGPLFHDTRKGTVAHAAAPKSSVAQAEATAQAGWIVFPTFRQDAPASVDEISRAEAFMLIQQQSFNQERMGDVGFETLCALLTQSRCYRIEYGSTEDGLNAIQQIVESTP
ncbi:HprK-related kinase A [Nitrogeniibacter mangrovi]|uniref:HprK-related kinase A n=1 Tax=Nitrogeniibacter mangrovi TaxID=2016596 RepID=A0A6C1B2R5_9RHOO|nr:HprK-related kinase A [Nitrogeniibacter mangrovi]QID17128.1 HprK-related kinase A [Nitrogeniibacter mangrovi]